MPYCRMHKEALAIARAIAKLADDACRERRLTMCNLYSMTRAREAVLRLFRVSDNRAEQFDASACRFLAQAKSSSHRNKQGHDCSK